MHDAPTCIHIRCENVCAAYIFQNEDFQHLKQLIHSRDEQHQRIDVDLAFFDDKN